MPLHLDPLSRRRFIRGSAILALTTTARPLLAGSGGSESWALLSDTHIDADPAKISKQGVNMADHLKQVVSEVVAEKETLSGVIINGDCAFLDGQPGDYTTFLELIDPFRKAGLPVHLTLGNHDDRGPFESAFDQKHLSSPVSGKHCSLIETPLVNWILLDSLRYVDKVEGEFGEEQLAWLGRIIDAFPDKPCIVVGHHYPQVYREDIIPGDRKVKISGLVDSEAFLAKVSPRTAAKAYIYGHSHTWLNRQNDDGLHEINLPPTAYVFSPDRPSGWVRATVSSSDISIELRAINAAHPQHGEKHLLEWR